MCYYNTYLKEHQLQYDTMYGKRKEVICLRDCHAILMLDNLVRLKYLADPNPGECRTKQLCTLPITLQGLPTDSSITSEWHLSECDGSEYCLCKHPEELGKADISRTLLKLTPNEEHFHRQFFRLMTWGNSLLWTKLTDDILVNVDSDTSSPAQFEDQARPSDGQNPVLEVLEDLNDDREQQLEEDDDLMNILGSIDDAESDDISDDDRDDDGDDDNAIADIVSGNDMSGELLELEQSIDHMSILDSDKSLQNAQDVKHLLSSFGFSKFKVPPLLCRHPPPATGRDDDLFKIREILDDTLKKMGYEADPRKYVNRILCGPDNKIGKSLLSLMRLDPKYKAFLPEFPLLHLRKSKITILFSAYQDAGLIQLVKFMRDDNQDDWRKLVSVQHIDMATRYVRRIAMSFHLAFLVVFSKSLGVDEQECFWNDMETVEAVGLAENWSIQFEDFIKNGSEQNNTFALHVDMMRHCDNVVAIAFAERLGGPDGYALVLAAVKESLKFSFVNNATSYAPYCVKLLYQHYSAGFFHRCMKHTLHSTPFKDSNRYFACDTKRELDHIEALKGFRSGSNMASVTCRMSLMDTLNEARDHRSYSKGKPHDEDNLGWDITEVDEQHIFPTTALILRQGGLSIEENSAPCNVYTRTPILLPSCILEDQSNGTGEYLLMRFLANEKMFQLSNSDLPSAENIKGPSELVSRARRSKGITIKRTTKSKVVTAKSESQMKEENRQKSVAKETKLIDCFSSSNNACQAIVKPDSTKPKVMKAVGMQRALKELIEICRRDSVTKTDAANSLILLNQSYIPRSLSTPMTMCVVEFAGVKFKIGNIKTGKEYLQHIETMLAGFFQQMPALNKIVICEEKYSFTPDDFKAGTRQQRKSKGETSVDHLKTSSNIINDNVLNKDAVTKTTQGKMAISTYLAQNMDKLVLNHSFQMIVDSELHLKNCQCQDTFTCQKYTTPILCSFSKTEGKSSPSIELMPDIKQRKGEAEMAVADWLINLKDELKEGDTAVSIILSGDIDAVSIYLYTVSRFWARDDQQKFKNPVFVVLQKPRGRLDIYDITGMLTLFENRYLDINIGTKVALGLCIGGNDFVPKLHQVSHQKVLTLIINNQTFRENLFIFDGAKVLLNQKYFTQLFKTIYCPKKYQSSIMSYQDIRALTIGKTEVKSAKGGFRTNDPRKRLPPESAIERLGALVHLQIVYLETVGIHDAVTPNFLESNCLFKNSSNEIEYNFGQESHFESFEELPCFAPVKASSKKRQLDTTPQRGLRRKRPLTSTPKSIR